VEQRLAAACDVDAPDRNRDHVGPRRFVRRAHDLMGRILAGPDDQPRAERAAGNDEGFAGSWQKGTRADRAPGRVTPDTCGARPAPGPSSYPPPTKLTISTS